MIQAKLKKCNGCDELKLIWKSDKKDKYCKECWYKKDPPKKVNPISKKMKVTMDEYSKKRTAFLALYPMCQAKVHACSVTATDVHHMAGRGENHNNVNTWIAVCRNCHSWIETNPDAAKELGFSQSRLNNNQ